MNIFPSFGAGNCVSNSNLKWRNIESNNSVGQGCNFRLISSSKNLLGLCFICFCHSFSQERRGLERKISELEEELKVSLFCFCMVVSWHWVLSGLLLSLSSAWAARTLSWNDWQNWCCIGFWNHNVPLDMKGCICHCKVADTPFHIQGDD